MILKLGNLGCHISYVLTLYKFFLSLSLFLALLLLKTINTITIQCGNFNGLFFRIVNVVVRDIELSKSFAHDANSFIFILHKIYFFNGEN
jgi:hypothetical protein